MGFDTHETANLLGLIPKSAQRGSREARLGAERVRMAIKLGRLKARHFGTSWRIYTPHLIEHMEGHDGPLSAK
jgi:hypothetical protein